MADIKPSASIEAEHKVDVGESQQYESHNSLLTLLIKQIKKVDFYKVVNIESGQKLKQKHYIISSVEQLLALAEKNTWNMCKHNEAIFLFNGAYWKQLEKEEVKKFLSDAAYKMGIDKYDARHFRYANNLLEQFMFSANFNKPIPMLDKVLINLRNGTFEIDDGRCKLRAFDPLDFLTYQLKFDYQPSAKCPKFLSYLNKVLPDIDCQEILAEFIGYVFTKNLKLEKCLVLYGSGSNGKSVFFDVINALLGEENISNNSLESLGSEYHRAEIANKLINYGSEIAGNISVDLFKRLASGEPVDARQIYCKPFTIRNYAKLLFNANSLPKDIEHNHAFFRRFLIIPFEVTVPKHEQNKNLANEIIKEELSGVFNWVLEGLERLLENQKFTESHKVNDQLERYKMESDSVHLFVDFYSYTKSNKDYRLLSDLYRSYKEFCMEASYKALNRKNFKSRISRLGYEVKRISTGVVVYIAL